MVNLKGCNLRALSINGGGIPWTTPALSPALIGIGYIIGPRYAFVNVAGGVLAWWVLIPLLLFFDPDLAARMTTAPAGTEIDSTVLARSPELLELHARLHEIADRLGTLHRARALRRLGRRRLDVVAEQRLEQLDDVMRQLRLTSARTLRLALEQCANEAARELDKPIAFTCSGEDVSVDREVLERVREPLTHLVRNAVDHGIEDTERVGAARVGDVRAVL